MLSFSIIVPYYNSSKFVEKNLSSIINQNYKKELIQIILVDDGSSDNSQECISNIEKKYNFKIDYYKKENGNWGSVINYVVKNNLIKNDLVMILDSDDMLKSDCFTYVNQNIKDADIYAITYKRWDGKNKETKKIYPYWSISRNINNKRKKTPFCAPLHYFYKKELFNNFELLEEKVFYQDSILLARMINKSNKIRYTKKPLSLYFYNRTDSSTNQSWSEQRFEQEYNACLKLIKLGWEEIVVYRLCIREFRKCCDKYNKKFIFNKEPKFDFFPLIIKILFSIYYKIRLKKYLSFR